MVIGNDTYVRAPESAAYRLGGPGVFSDMVRVWLATTQERRAPFIAVNGALFYAWKSSR